MKSNLKEISINFHLTGNSPYSRNPSHLELIRRGMIFAREKIRTKHQSNADSLNKKNINEIIYNEKSRIVAIFKDFLIFDDGSELLKRYYKSDESLLKLKKIFHFYETFSKIFPNYINFQEESKYMYKNIQRKQKIIDQMRNEKIRQFSDEKESDIIIFNTEVCNSLQSATSQCDLNKKFTLNECDQISLNEDITTGSIEKIISSLEYHEIAAAELKKKEKLFNTINIHEKSASKKKEEKGIGIKSEANTYRPLSISRKVKCQSPSLFPKKIKKCNPNANVPNALKKVKEKSPVRFEKTEKRQRYEKSEREKPQLNHNKIKVSSTITHGDIKHQMIPISNRIESNTIEVTCKENRRNSKGKRGDSSSVMKMTNNIYNNFNIISTYESTVAPHSTQINIYNNVEVNTDEKQAGNIDHVITNIVNIKNSNCKAQKIESKQSAVNNKCNGGPKQNAGTKSGASPNTQSRSKHLLKGDVDLGLGISDLTKDTSKPKSSAGVKNESDVIKFIKTYSNNITKIKKKIVTLVNNSNSIFCTRLISNKRRAGNTKNSTVNNSMIKNEPKKNSSLNGSSGNHFQTINAHTHTQAKASNLRRIIHRDLFQREPQGMEEATLGCNLIESMKNSTTRRESKTRVNLSSIDRSNCNNSSIVVKPPVLEPKHTPQIIEALHSSSITPPLLVTIGQNNKTRNPIPHSQSSGNSQINLHKPTKSNNFIYGSDAVPYSKKLLVKIQIPEKGLNTLTPNISHENKSKTIIKNFYDVVKGNRTGLSVNSARTIESQSKKRK